MSNMTSLALLLCWFSMLGNVHSWVSTRLSTNRASLGTSFTSFDTLLNSQSNDASADSSSSSSSSAVTTEPTTIVTIDCRLLPEGDFVPVPLIDGVCYHKEDPPVELVFCLNQGNYLPGLHALIQDLQIGECVENVSLDAGWGAHNPDLVATLTFADSGLDPTQVKVGTQLYLPNNGLTCTVTQVTDESFTMDANPPLAGASYSASVTLKAVEPGPALRTFDEHDKSNDNNSRYQICTVALGCFWGGELMYMRTPGVVGTRVGYTQGHVENPTYQDVCSGTTGHTEAIAVVYDPDLVSFDRLVHLAMDRLGEDKYLLNQVGNDKGTQYRHGVYSHTPAQLQTARAILHSFGEDCVTECLPATVFWTAEDYHQQYLLKGGQSAKKNDQSTIRCYG